MDIKTSVVAILNDKNKIIGTGFVAGENLILTCAHVVEQATAGLNERVIIRFSDNSKTEATVEQPSFSPSYEKDVALLRVDSLPQGILPLPLGNAAGSAGRDFYAYGYATATDVQGIGARGKIVDIVNNGRLVQLTSQEPDHGMSGGPVLDEQCHVVIGMVTKGKGVVGEDKSARNIFTTFATSIEVIRDACPKLRLTEICPYRSLDVFNEEDAPFFFGREKVVQKLLDSLKREPRFLAVLGPSGSGKSSVVRAGLIPALRQGKVPGSQKWEIVTIRPTNDPFEQLAGVGFINLKVGLESSVKTWLSDRSDRTRLVLFIDQFEEVLVSTLKDVREKFISELAQLLDSPLAITVILSFRDDFYSRLLRDAAQLSNWLEQGLVNIPPILEQDELQAMITKPADFVGMYFEEGLVDVIIVDAADADRAYGMVRSTILPLLEFALTQLWDLRADNRVTHSLYHSIGGVSGGLSRWADNTYYSLSEDERKLARQILTHLINIGDESQGIHDTKRISLHSEIAVNENENVIVQKLVQARLITTSYDNILKQDKIEIIHESLFQKWGLLTKWIREDRDYLRIRRQLGESAKEWELSDFDKGLLYRGARLGQTIQFLEMYPDRALQKLEREFLDASIRQQKNEVQIEKSISTQGTILEAIPDGILVTDPDNQVTFVNQSLEVLLSLSKNQLLRRRLESLSGLYPVNMNAVIKNVEGWTLSPDRHKTEHSYNEQIVLDNGKIVVVSLSPVIWQGEFLGTVSIFRDVTRETEVDRLKSEFIQTISHELRTPIIAIRGYADILVMGAVGTLSENQTHFLEIIKNNTERLSALINDLLDISRFEQDRVSLSSQVLDLREIAADIIEVARQRLQGDNKPLNLCLETQDVLPVIYGDGDRIRQVLDNLVENACNYTQPNGEVAIHISSDGDEVQCGVKDDGIGIPVKDQDRIFERFFRGEDPLVLNTPGTGLGLAIAKQIVEMHQGRIWFQSSGVPGEGSLFSFTLPVRIFD